MKKRPVTFRGFRFRFVTVNPRKFFGYRRERVGDLPVVTADQAKAIVDSLDLSRYAGGIEEVCRALRAALDTVEVPVLVEYANRMGDKSLGSRLGYLLETLGHPVTDMIRSASPVKLAPARARTGPVDRKWQVIVNLPEAEWTSQGVG
jgi:predicted transcriptional regulator of viral defense system